MTLHIMVDLETFSTSPNAVVVQLAAVKFDPFSEHLGDIFNVPIDPESGHQLGLHMDMNTVLWWMTQSDDARKRITSPVNRRVQLKEALRSFQQWLPKESKVWGNGAAFDLPILESAYRAVGIPTPWKHWDERCYRTLKAMAPELKMVREGVHHDALDDAKSQARHLQAIIKHLGLKNV